MARQGRELEILIAKIEQSALPDDANIESPGIVVDKITNQMREVDILVEYIIGTTPIKIAFECRDRKSSQDSQWIEQIASKLKDTELDKIVVVSSSQFTGPALTKAKHYGIETRNLKSIDNELVSSWWPVPDLSVITTEYSILNAMIKTDKDELTKDYLLDKVPTDNIFIRNVSIEDKASLNQILEGVIGEIPSVNQLSQNGEKVEEILELNYENPDDHFVFQIRNKTVKVLSIYIHASFKLTHKMVPISSVKEYTGSNKTISSILEYDIQNPNQEKLQIIKAYKDGILLSISKPEES